MTMSETMPTPVRQTSRLSIADAVLAVITVFLAGISILLVPMAAPFATGLFGLAAFARYKRDRRSLWLVATVICAALLVVSILVLLLSSSGSYDMTSTSTTSSTS